MGKPVGGTCYFKVDGEQLELASDDVTVKNFQGFTRESKAAGLFLEKDVIPEVKGTFLVPKGFPRDKVLKGTDMTITVEFKTGDTAVLSGAYVVDDVEHNVGSGELPLTFNGTKGEYI